MKLYYWNFYRLKKFLQTSGALLLIGALICSVLAKEAITTAAIGTLSQPIYKVKTKDKIAALTFDISWGTEVPGPVLDILKEHNIKSTFFLSGPWAKKYPEYPKRLVADGHEIASHGNQHINLDQESEATIKAEINTAQQSIEEITGKAPHFIRTPNGAWNDKVIDIANELNYQIIQWSVDSLDWRKPGVDAIVSRVLDNIHPGAIILMHASDTCLQTPEALPKVLEGLQEKGYTLVTVSELLQHGTPMYK